MAEQNLSQGDVERRGGPAKQALSRLLREWQGARSLDPDTLPQLAKALGLSQRTLGRIAAVDMGLLPPDEARDDALAMLSDALRESADPREMELVVAAARAVWQVVRDESRPRAVEPTPIRRPKPAAAPSGQTRGRAADASRNEGKAIRKELDRQAETPPPVPEGEP